MFNLTWVARLQDHLSPAINAAQQNVDRFGAHLDKAEKSYQSAFDRMGKSTHSWAAKNPKIAEAVESYVPGAAEGLGLLTNGYMAAGAGITALGAATFSAYKQNLAFDKSLAEFNVTAHMSGKALAGVKDELLSTAGASLVENFNDVPTALTRIVSAGLPVGQSIKDLSVHLKGAHAGFVDVEVAATAASRVMSAANINNTTKAYDLLVATTRDGAAEFKDIAQYLPKLLPTGRSMGIAANETAAAFSFFTKVGNDAAASTTLVENMYKAMASSDRRKAFDKLGVKIIDEKGTVRALDKISIDLEKRLAKAKSDGEKIKILGSLGLDMEAQRGFATMAQNVDKLSESFSALANNKGALDNAFNDSLTDADKWQLAMNKMTEAATRFGGVVAPIFGRLADDLVKTIGQLSGDKKSTQQRDLAAFDMMEKGYRPKTSWDVVTGKNHRSDELGRFYSKGDDVDKEKGARLKAMTLAQMGKYDEARQSIQNSPVWDKENSGDRADKDRAYKDILSTIAFEKKKNGIKEDSPDHAIAAKGGKFSEDTDKTKKMHRAAADNAEGVVIGGGRKQTNFYITIQKMNEGGINIHTTNLREGAAETKQIVEEMMLRAVSDWQVMAGD